MVEKLPELMAQLELFQPACLRKWIVLGFAWALNAFKYICAIYLLSQSLPR